MQNKEDMSTKDLHSLQSFQLKNGRIINKKNIYKNLINSQSTISFLFRSKIFSLPEAVTPGRHCVLTSSVSAPSILEFIARLSKDHSTINHSFEI